MTLAPESIEALQESLRRAHAEGRRVEAVDLSGLAEVVEHRAEDMVVTVQGGCPLRKLQEQLALHRQWLPLDPPHPGALTIRELLDANRSGPHRYGFGTVREHILGFAAVLADGRLIRAGGKVVKNVAGYDLHRLFIGAGGALGVIVEATFKLWPVPERESCLRATCRTVDEAWERLEAVLASPLQPVVLDLYRGVPGAESNGAVHLVAGFAGTEADVEWQVNEARRLGLSEPGDLAYEEAFHRGPGEEVRSRAVLPSKLIEVLRELEDAPFVARAGNGVVRWRGGPSAPAAIRSAPAALLARLKDAFDPKHILPELP